MTSPMPPTSDDKLWAGLSYAGMAIFAIPSVAIYLLKKEESAYIKFHSLQAIGFFLAALVVCLVLGLLTTIPVLGLLFMVAVFLVNLGLLGYWIYLMVQAFMGKDPRIPLLSDQIEANFMA